MRILGRNLAALAFLAGATVTTYASEADINTVHCDSIGVSGMALMYFGIVICALGAVFGIVQYKQTKALPVHESMATVSNTIWETCKTYLIQQGKFLSILWVLIALCILYYFVGLESKGFGEVLVILACSVLGILGSYV